MNGLSELLPAQLINEKPHQVLLRVVGIWWHLAIGICLVTASVTSVAADQPAARLAALADRYFEEKLRLNPIQATAIGDERYEGDLAIDIAPEHRRQRMALYQSVALDLAHIQRKALGSTDRLNHDLLNHAVSSLLSLEQFPSSLLPIDQMDSLPLLLANWSSGEGEQPLRTLANYERFLARIGRLPEWVDQAIANMRLGIRKGIVQPRPLIESVLPQLDALATLPAEKNPFFRPTRIFPETFGKEDREHLQAAYRQAVEQRIAPAMRKLVDFLASEYLPAARRSAGIGSLPGGKAWYAALVRHSTTTRLKPEQIHVMGLKEVSRIQAEIDKLIGPLQYEGDPRRLLVWANSETRFRPFRSETEILDAYRRLDARIAPRLKELFGRLPEQALEVRAEPELTRATASDHYTMPAQDGSRPGIFWAVITDPANYKTPRMTALYLHEGRPGHHFHLAMQQKLDLPRFRRFGWIDAYGEGWALYAESLGDLLGVYDDPAARLGRLQMELMRAVRLVVDTGLHRYGWSREKAMGYMMEIQGIDEEEARNATERYMALPGQALAYKVGELKILALRQKARQQLGARFLLADFHDLVLIDGAMPLDLLETKINRWLAASR